MPGCNILLIEPAYKNKYPPLGLMKIAQYHGPNGRRDYVRFVKGMDTNVLHTHWDRIYITTLFSFEWRRTAEAIDFALTVANGQSDRVFVGGIAASLMHEAFCSEPRWSGVRFIRGLLDQPPAMSLQLDAFSEELYSDDCHGTPIENLIPDYSILDHIDYRYPVSDAYFTYASRGCIRKCSFCGVPKLEGSQRDAPSITSVVSGIEKSYGLKKDLILMDNNVVASAKFKEIVAEIRDLGFIPGAKLKVGRAPVQRRVDFNQGVDARILSKDPMFLRELSTICIKPLRIAFDHLGLRKPYEKSIRIAHDYGLNELSNYMLYNFHDTPTDLFERMRLNVELNEELETRIWSFPMRYHPIYLKDRSHIGKNWNRYFLRSMQIILQATHGVVSGTPDFFKAAFGNTYNEFEEILLRPHHFIFNRVWYEQLEGRAELDDYQAKARRLSVSQRQELLDVLSSHDPSQYAWAKQEKVTDPAIKAVMSFYEPPSKAWEREIWARQAEILAKRTGDEIALPEDERVEDAGLEEDVLTGAATTRSPARQNEVNLSRSAAE